ncbi:MAG: type II secretion system protein GspG [Proteobacteria bacterium]|nr:type II secretion system protein GspG [Pseudomonadota bacterium]
MLSWVPVLGALLSLIALLLGVQARAKKDPRKGFVQAGIITGAVGIGVGVLLTVLLAGPVVLGRFGEAREKDARIGACTINSAVQLYMAEHPRKCPSLEDLKDGYLDAARGMRDPWDQDYVIDCTGQGPDVYSVGPDGQGGEPIHCEKNSF